MVRCSCGSCVDLTSGHASDFTQPVDSMQIDNKLVQQGTVGQSVGIKVKEHAREHDSDSSTPPSRWKATVTSPTHANS
jgi:hypothetical protein